jgi:uncharacterized OsmC-like protein
MSNAAVRETLEKLGAALSADPGKARVKSSATARLAGGLRCEVSGPRGERSATDMPPGVGGQGSAPNPGWHLRAAMASCTATAIAMRAAKLGIPVTTLEVTVESESDQRFMLGLDPSVAAGFTGWRTSVKIAGDAPADQLKELVAWADSHSPVGCALRDPAACSLQVEVV